VRNRGLHPITIAGGDGAPYSGSNVTGEPGPVDLTLVFRPADSRSLLQSVPAMFRHAARFRPGWVGAWTYWALAALVALAVPLLCALALARAARDGP
jgi:hypothetical protein